jgi:hypothetical protein
VKRPTHIERDCHHCRGTGKVVVDIRPLTRSYQRPLHENGRCFCRSSSEHKHYLETMAALLKDIEEGNVVKEEL